MKKSVWIVLAITALLGSSGYFFLARTYADVSEQPERKSEETTAHGPSVLEGAVFGKSSGEGAVSDAGKSAEKSLEDMLGLAIKGISLFQGEGGVELWRLKASWAHITEEGGVIDVDSPVVRYTLGEPELGDYMDVVAEKGRVTDNQRRLDLWGNVVVTRADQKVTGPRLNYDAATRIMVFPEGADLDGPTAFGTAPHFTWNLAENVMTGEGGVTVVLKARPAEPLPKSEGAGSAAAPSPVAGGTTTPKSDPLLLPEASPGRQ